MATEPVSFAASAARFMAAGTAAPQHSDEIDKLAEALSKAQGEMVAPPKNRTNDYFKSHYADLSAVIEAVRAPFSKNGLAFIQYPESSTAGERTTVAVTTVLMHTSGQWTSSRLELSSAVSEKPHAVGSAITYARRYSLQAVAGISAEDDDDGNAATKPQSQPAERPTTSARAVKPKAAVPFTEKAVPDRGLPPGATVEDFMKSTLPADLWVQSAINRVRAVKTQDELDRAEVFIQQNVANGKLDEQQRHFLEEAWKARATQMEGAA